MRTNLIFALALALFCFTLGCATAPGVGADMRGLSSAEPSQDWEGALNQSFFAQEKPGAAGSMESDASVALDVEDPSMPMSPAALARQVIYSAQLGLVVVSATEARAAVLRIAESRGGYLQRSDATSIAVRVPAAKFDEAVAAIELLGEVIERNIQASDVTEEMFDLEIRLENAQRARERLLAHLENSERIEDTIKIEAELTRLTGEIERMEGRKRFLASQVALSTITVRFGSRSLAGSDVSGGDVPFDWISRLGDGLLAGTVQGQPKKPRFLANGPKFDAPETFVRYYQSDDLVEAMDAGDLRIKLQRHSNFDRGALAFWLELARRQLVEGRAVALASERTLDDDRALLRGSREVAGELQGYMLVLVRDFKRIYTFEAWGPKERFDAAFPALEASARSLRP